MIRRVHADELGRLRAIERAAGEAFRQLGMDAIAEDEPPPDAELARYREAGRAWVWAGAGDLPVGYLLVDVVDGGAHIAQVSVDPIARGSRIGAALIHHAGEWARAHGLGELTLTTFADVPWNRPYYERLGFAVRPIDSLGPGLRAIWTEEIGHGLHRWPRVVMIRPL